MEQLLLHIIRPQVRHVLNPLQFAYQEKVAVEDAIIYLLHRANSYLDKGKGVVRIMFFDFSSAFNTIQPLRLSDKLLQMGPQGTLLSPVLFTLYTSDFTYNTESCNIQKFSDDTAIVGCIRDGQEGEYRSLVDNFVQWCRKNHLQLNTSKTKEMVVDFRKSPLLQVSIEGVNVEVVNTYKYLRVHLDNKLDRSAQHGCTLQEG